MLDALMMTALAMTIATPVLVLGFDCWKWIGATDAMSQPLTAGLTFPALPIREGMQMVAMQNQAGSDSGSKPNPDGLASENSISLDIPADVSEVIITDFRPNVDSCRIWLRSSDIYFDHWAGSAGAVLAFQDGAERLTITFQGLDRPPFEDIETAIDCPDAGLRVRALADPGGEACANVLAEK
ncbi:MAG: hypothetical protein ACR2OY_05845 [Boseongicola sp.]